MKEAKNIADLGGDPLLIGMIGDDSDGQRITRYCEEAGLPLKAHMDSTRPTTKKTRIIANNQQVCRVDQEQDIPVSEEQLDQIFKTLQGVVHDHSVVILSDYGKGLISSAFMARFMRLILDMKTKPRVLVDPKTVNYDVYKGVDLLTPNNKEAGEGAGFQVKGINQVIKAGRALFQRLECAHLLITLGAEGMALFETPDSVFQIPTVARKVYDVTGAGDTVIGALGLALAGGVDLLTACVLANYAAGITVGQVGAATATSDALKAVINSLPLPDIRNITSKS